MLRSEGFARSLLLIAIAFGFGLQSFRYSFGRIDLAGPGLFPLVVSVLLGVIGLTGVVRAWVVRTPPLVIEAKNISLVVLSLVGMALAGEYINMTVGIIALVFCATLAGTDYSIWRNVKLTLALVTVAFFFQRAFGLPLNLL